MRFLPLFLLLAAGVPSLSVAQEHSTTAPNAAREVAPSTRSPLLLGSATRVSQPPVLDGREDDVAWTSAHVIDQFLEYEPNSGATPRFRTEVRVLYDDKYLYVLARMFDPAPDSIVSLLSRRDVRTESDQLKLVIDSYHDRRTAYQFVVNPAGVKRDFYVYDDNNEDATWDAVWDVVTRVDSLGWLAEFRIPFSQIRFNKERDKRFGLMVVREIARTKQRISWPLLHRDMQGYVSQAGEIDGINGLPQPRRLEVSPYVVTKNSTRRDPSGAYSTPQALALGADVKLGLGSNLTLDATINPDFGQVEADPSVLNLSAFEQFFEERRPFFLEGAGIFQFLTACNDVDHGCTGLFYSRRIGRSPQLRGLYGNDDSPTASRILGATKLSGRLASGLSAGMLAAVTERELGVERRTLEPQSTYVVGRLSQDFRKGQSGIGLMLTGVDRSLDHWSAPYLRNNAITGGLDARHRFGNQNYEVSANVAASRVTGSAAAIAATQRNSVHQYDRPDDGLAYDTTRTALFGDLARISLSKFGGGITRFQTLLQRFSPGFESNDVGFQSRADEQLFRNWFSLQYTKPRLFYRRLQANFLATNTWNTAGLALGQSVNINVHSELKNTWWIHAGGNLEGLTATYDDRVARGGPALRQSPSWSTWGVVEFDRRKWLTPVVYTGVHQGDAGRSSGWWISPSLNLRLASRISAAVGANFNHAVNDAQWFTNVASTTGGPTRYTFARLDQTTVNMTGRINYTASPTLSLQLYAQPFASTGDYSDWRELKDPRATAYADRFTRYSTSRPGGFNVRHFNSNTVIRWEYRPASTLFFVWQQGRDGSDATATDFRFRRDVSGVFDLHPMNTLLIKASFWFNP